MTWQGMTPALVAASRGSVRALEVLVEVGHADLRARDKKGRTVVALAKLGNHHNVLDLLRVRRQDSARHWWPESAREAVTVRAVRERQLRAPPAADRPLGFPPQASGHSTASKVAAIGWRGSSVTSQ